jgi:adenylyltransferase/sulfurtransferase
MSTSNYKRPRLPSHFYVLVDPPDSSGDEVLHFVSQSRKIKLKGHSFREFQQLVIPFLDGKHTLVEIQERVADIFQPEDLDACFRLLAEQNLLEDADDSPSSEDLNSQLEPQLNFFHELSAQSGRAQERLRNSTVAVIGLGGAGASVALSLAAANVGTLVCIDALPVAPADPYLTSVFKPNDVGMQRAEVVRRCIEVIAPRVKASVISETLQTDAAVNAAVQGTDFVVCCTDTAQSSLAYKLNRVCLQTGVRWTSCEAAGVEVVVGPTIEPYQTACYLCYKMRLVASNEHPEDEFAFQRFLDQRNQDDSGCHENLVFGVGLASNLVGLEVLKALTGTALATRGRIVVVDLLDFTMTKHVVLRKPWCPACFNEPANASAKAAHKAD